jgi:hypothetical protein
VFDYEANDEQINNPKDNLKKNKQPIFSGT